MRGIPGEAGNKRGRPRPDVDRARRAAWARFVLGVGLLSAFFWFLTTEPVPPGAAGDVIHRNMREDVQADALFYADLERMPTIERTLARH